MKTTPFENVSLAGIKMTEPKVSTYTAVSYQHQRRLSTQMQQNEEEDQSELKDTDEDAESDQHLRTASNISNP